MKPMKLMLAFLVVIALVAFALANMHYTFVSFIVGSPVQIRLIVLLLSAFLLGAITAFFFHVARRFRLGSRASRHILREDLTDTIEDID